MLKSFKKSLLFLGLLVFFSFFIISNGWAKTYSQLLVFGDSLSDEGKKEGHAKFTDDEVWAEYLLSKEAFLEAEYKNNAKSGDTLKDMKEEIEAYTEGIKENSLVAIWIGGNDIKEFMTAIAAYKEIAGKVPQNLRPFTEEYTQALEYTLTMLISTGQISEEVGALIIRFYETLAKFMKAYLIYSGIEEQIEENYPNMYPFTEGYTEKLNNMLDNLTTAGQITNKEKDLVIRFHKALTKNIEELKDKINPKDLKETAISKTLEEEPISKTVEEEFTERLKNNLVPAIEDLMSKGARKFVFLNVPDLGTTPGIHMMGEDAIKLASKVSAGFNSLYYIVLKKFFTNAGSPYSFHLYNVYEFLNDIIDDVKEGKIKLKLAPDFYIGNLGATGINPEDYLFYDPLHPTSAAHKMLADDFYDFVVNDEGKFPQAKKVDSEIACFIDSVNNLNGQKLISFILLFASFSLLIVSIKKKS